MAMASGKTTHTVFVIENSNIDFTALQRACNKTSFAGRVALTRFCSAEEALEHLAKAETMPDLFLIDINLKEKSGLELLEDLAKVEKCALIPKIICSTSDNPQEVRECFVLGGVGFIVKPLGIKLLARLLEKCLGYWFTASRIPL